MQINNEKRPTNKTSFHPTRDNSDNFDDLEEIEVGDAYIPKYQRESSPQGSRFQLNPLIKEALSFVQIIVVAVIVALILNTFVIINAQVPTGSMRNTIMEDNRLIGFRLAYTFSDPQRFDIVIFKFPDNESENYIKRIIGLPGDVVEITSGKVYVNGKLLDEPYLREPMAVNETPLTYTVPEGHYFMLGDNRNSSQDSRAWVNTYVAKDKILAKAIFKYYDSGFTFKLLK